MRWMRLRVALGMLPFVPVALHAGQAADLLPACSAAHDGVQTCMTRQVCTCGFDPGGSLTGRSPGWRWQCDIMQTCDLDTPPDAAPPAAPPWPGPLYVTPNLNQPGQSQPGAPTMPMPPFLPRP
jgi:hypothetical protein